MAAADHRPGLTACRRMAGHESGPYQPPTPIPHLFGTRPSSTHCTHPEIGDAAPQSGTRCGSHSCPALPRMPRRSWAPTPSRPSRSLLRTRATRICAARRRRASARDHSPGALPLAEVSPGDRSCLADATAHWFAAPTSGCSGCGSSLIVASPSRDTASPSSDLLRRGLDRCPTDHHSRSFRGRNLATTGDPWVPKARRRRARCQWSCSNGDARRGRATRRADVPPIAVRPDPAVLGQPFS